MFNARSFQRYYNHKSSFAHEIYRHKTCLSNYVWKVKNKFDIDPILKQAIMKRCNKYKGVGNRYCKLCMEEKLTTIIISSCAISADIPDPLLPLLPIVHRFWKVLRATSHILTELLNVGSSWSPCFCSAMWRGSSEYIAYELVPTSTAVSCMSGSSNLDSFCDGW